MSWTPWLHRRSRLIVVVMGLIAMGGASRALAQVYPGPVGKGAGGPVPVTIGTTGRMYLPAIGGSGGGQFFALCPRYRNLVGFEMRVGDDVDAIRPVCAESFEPGAQRTTGLYPVSAPDWNGGLGGGYLPLLCPRETPIVIGLDVAAQGQRTAIVHNIHVFCGRAVAAQSAASNPSAVFDGNGVPNSLNYSERCPAGQVAVGMHGRSGVWLDAMGLICDAPTVWTAEPREETVKTLGMAICVLAREARARNSSDAPGLEEKCRAADRSGQTGPLKAIGRVKVPTPADAKARSVCDVAAEARTRNSPATPGLEANCRANLAATGAAIAEADPIVSDARAAETDAMFKQGFDIATGIFGDPALGAQGHTATGPNSLRIRASLSVAGQRGFDASVKLHLSRNYKP